MGELLLIPFVKFFFFFLAKKNIYFFANEMFCIVQ